MPHRLIVNLKPYHSKKNQDIVDRDDSRSFIASVIEHGYKNFALQKDVIGDTCYLNLHLLATAASSACIDISASSQVHDLDGSSIDKKAAAVCCWINRIKPIQMKEDADSNLCAYNNSYLALIVAINWLWPEENRLEDMSETLKEGEKFHVLLYTLLWRNPSYKELTTIFYFLKS